MGLIDRIRNYFSESENANIKPSPSQSNEEYEKANLANNIIDLIDKIKRKNSFDSSIWNLSNATTYSLKRKSLDELKNIYSTLENRLSQLEKKTNYQRQPSEEEAAKWTGMKTRNMTDHDLDVFQKGDDYR